MVRLTVWFKFTRKYEGKTLYHTGNHAVRATTLKEAEWFVQGAIEDMQDCGWVHLETRVIQIDYFSGG